MQSLKKTLQKHKKPLVAGGVSAALAGGLYFATLEDAPPAAYMGGNESSGHDIAVAKVVEGEVKFGRYCYSDSDDLRNAATGTPVFSPYADSYRCTFKSPVFPTVAIVGWSNAVEDVGASPVSNAITISAGATYGKAIDYYIDENTLSFALPVMANHVNRVQEARFKAGLPVLDAMGLKEVFDATSPGAHVVEGKYYGMKIDIEKAVEYATREPEPVDVSFLPAIYYQLGF